MADRTKQPRENISGGSFPTHIEGFGGEPIRSDLDQNPRIPAEWANVQLEEMRPVQSVGNQQAGPSAEFLQYTPTGKASTVPRDGLWDGDSTGGGLPKSKKYTRGPNAGKRSTTRE